jgi:glycosyltransferase involved in cell wall biosynthesis
LKAHVVATFDSALAGGSPQKEYQDQLGFPGSLVFTPYDVVDNDYFAAGAERARADRSAVDHLPGLADPHPYFLASGRFVARKNFGQLLAAYAAYREHTDRPWRLILLGDGPLRPELERLAASTDGVTFAGFRQIEELPAYYGLAGAFVHPSRTEPWGLVVNEAMAAGLPIISSTEVGATYDLVREGENGYRWTPGETAVHDLATLLTRISGQPEEDRRAMGARSIAIVAGWSPERFARGLADAIAAGRARADRPAPATLRATLWAIRSASRRVGSFHALKE